MAGPVASFNPMAARKAVDTLGSGLQDALVNEGAHNRMLQQTGVAPDFGIGLIYNINAPGNRAANPAQDANDTRLSAAVANAQKTGKAHVISTGTNAPEHKPGEMGNRFEYGLRVNPDGTGVVIAREYIGNPGNPVDLTATQKRQADAKLQQNGLAPLKNNEAGYHTIFAAEIDKAGNYKVLSNPDTVDMSQFGVSDERFGNLPRNPTPVGGGIAPAVQRPAVKGYGV